MGRPTIFSDELAGEICSRLAEGEHLKAICADKEMPARSSVYEWIRSNPVFADMYARARDLQYAKWAEEILDISDDGRNDFVERETQAGHVEVIADHEHINRSRLRVDTRKWLLSKLLPKQYGDKSSVELSGPDGGPIQHDVRMTQAEMRDFILSVVCDCPSCRAKAGAKLAEADAKAKVVPGGA